MGKKVDLSLAILNGLVGDHLVRTSNPLATQLALFQDGAPLPIEPRALAARLPRITSKVTVLVHGLMCTEDVWKMRDGTDYGSRLADDLGYTALYVRYNSGRAIADSGAALAALLTQLVRAYPIPIEEILPIGFSMGGLVIRSACHVAELDGQPWLAPVRRAIYVGTPHRGAPLERAGRVLSRALRAVPDPYTKLVADIADLRSDGLKDLGDADLTHEHRARASRGFSLLDARHPVPLLPSIDHYLVAGSIAESPELSLLFGDALVPISSATADTCADRASLALPPDHVKIFAGFAHVRLAHDPAIYAQMRAWCEGTCR